VRLGGIVFKSANSPLQIVSAGTYIRTGISGAGIGSGPIILDANGGNDAVYIRANTHYRYTSGSFIDSFGTSPGSISAVNVYGPQNNIFTGALSTLGGVAAGDSIQAIGNIVATGDVGKTAEPQRIVANINQVRQSAATSRGAAVTGLTSQIITKFESSERIGNPATAAGVSFGFPTGNSYGASQVKFARPHWDRVISAISPGTLRQWAEEPVVYQPRGVNRPTHMWPGEEAWKGEGGWVDAEVADGVFNFQTSNPLHPATSRERYEDILTQGMPVTPGIINDQLKFIP
jgi:hypothetical protein